MRTNSSGLFLLDANVLIALCWPTHSWHEAVNRWFSKRGSKGWATCPFTQSAFVRILSNPSFSRDALTPQNALRLMEANLEHTRHRFWSADLPVVDALRPISKRLSGHRQVLDAYLVGLAIRKKGVLATLDRTILQFAPSEAVEIVS